MSEMLTAEPMAPGPADGASVIPGTAGMVDVMVGPPTLPSRRTAVRLG